jgi:hypothetical protein
MCGCTGRVASKNMIISLITLITAWAHWRCFVIKVVLLDHVDQIVDGFNCDESGGMNVWLDYLKKDIFQSHGVYKA